MTVTFSERLLGSLNMFFEAVLRFLPGLLAAALILVIGLVVGWVLRLLVSRILRVAGFDRYCDASGVRAVLGHADIRTAPSILLGRALFWLVFLSFAMAGLSALQVGVINQLIAEFFLYLPRIISAVLVLLVGLLLGGFLSRAALLGAVNAGMPSPRLIAIVVKLLIVVLSFAMALEQLRIATSIVLAAFIIAFGAVMFGLALAFGLGGRGVARRVLERQWQRQREDAADGFSHL
jgi:hypothetical protein